MKIVYSSICETGKVRKVNQDSVYAFKNEDWGVFVVADGMGGHQHGEIASNEVTDAIRFWVETGEDKSRLDMPELARQIKRILMECNESIIRKTAKGEICGCTVVVLILIRKECMLITLGDSRCYEAKRENGVTSLVQLTYDDVVGGNGPDRGKLTNALGVRMPMNCRVRVLPIDGLHTYLVCSDGIYKFCEEKQMLSIMTESNWRNTEEKIMKLGDLVEENGAKDNFSAHLIKVDTDTEIETLILSENNI